MKARFCLTTLISSIGIFLFAEGVVFASGVNVDKEAVGFLEEQLRYQNLVSPNPTPLLLYLIHQGFIDANAKLDTYNRSCWTLKRPFLADGLDVSAICAFDTDPLIETQNPTLYTKQPGTDQTALAIFTTSEIDAVKKWFSDHVLLAESPAYAIVGPKDPLRSVFPYKSGTLIDCEN